MNPNSEEGSQSSMDDRGQDRSFREIERRLQEGREMLEHSGASSDPRDILRARAKALARQAPAESLADSALLATTTVQLVEFTVGYETYAVESRWVQEVYPLRDLTPLPCTPPFVLGILHVRGRILAVIDIKVLFALPPQGLSELNKIIVISTGEREVGIVVDAVLGIRQFQLDEIQNPLPTLEGPYRAFVKGITRDRSVVLDPLELLDERHATGR